MDVRPVDSAEIEREGKIFEVPSTAPANKSASMRIAMVHDWCPNFRGGERVLAEFCRMYPGSDVFTLFDFLPQDVKDEYFPGVKFTTSVAGNLPYVRKYYRSLFSFCPFLIEQFDVTGYDMVISSSAAFARGVITRPDQPHLCYVHSPARYAWDEQFSYLQQGRLGYGPKGMLYRWMLHHLRIWDSRTAHGPDMMLANSSFVRRRIQKIYGRDARVVHPPVEIDQMTFVDNKDDYFVTAAFQAPYKRTDLVIQAFNEMPSKRLIVVGEGQQSARLKAIAGPNIDIVGYLPRDEYIETVGKAQALVFAGCEDFGIALAEAQACGTPLIAFNRGGATDIVQPLGYSKQPTGVLFAQQTTTSIKDAVEHFTKNRALIEPANCRQSAKRFGQDVFTAKIRQAYDDVLRRHDGEGREKASYDRARITWPVSESRTAAHL